MSIITNTFNADSAVGVRENLIDVIYNVAPTDTPFSASIGKAKATSPLLYEWQTDTLAAPSTANAQLQGDDIASFDVVTATVRRGNRIQTSRKTAIISAQEQLALKAGRKDEIAYQIMKKGKELRRDIELICLANQGAVAPVSGATAGTIGAVLAWVKTNTDKGSGGADPSVADGTGTRTDGTLRTFAETLMKNVLQKVYIASGEQPDLIMAPPNLKATISTFPANSTRYIDAEAKELIAGVDVYVSDWGSHRVVPNRFMRNGLAGTGREILAINTDMWKMVWFRPITMQKLAKTGDADKFMLVADWSIQSSNEAASGGAFDLQ